MSLSQYALCRGKQGGNGMDRPKCALAIGSAVVLATGASVSGLPAVAAPGIAVQLTVVVDPIHPNGEPDIGIDPQGRVFVSGPTGTGTQRSTWFGSVDKGHTFRVISPGPPPSAIAGLIDPPGGGDTDINFDRSAKQYFIDLYALTCNRTATTADGGATVSQSVYPAGCAGVPGADRPWLAVFDPADQDRRHAHRFARHSVLGALHGLRPQPVCRLEYQRQQSGASPGLRQRCERRQRMVKLDPTGTGQRRFDGNGRCGQRLSLDQGRRTGTRRCGLVWIGQECRSEQPVGPELERLHVPGGLPDQCDRWADRGGALHAPRQGQSASDALQRHLPTGNGMHRVA